MNTALDILTAICEQHVIDSTGVVFGEPYVPYIPDDWNGVLVVAESQNLSKTNQAYVDGLRAASPQDRIRRLKPAADGSLGIQPWDDGILPLAVEAALGQDAHRAAVSNAVPWSSITSSGSNANPVGDLIGASIQLWRALLQSLRPSHIVTAGAVARRVIAAACGDPDTKVSGWTLPSPRLLSPLSAMVSVEDLLSRYPEVRTAMAKHPTWNEPSRLKNRVLYACLAVGQAAEEPRIATRESAHGR